MLNSALRIVPQDAETAVDCNFSGSASALISDSTWDRWSQQLDIPSLLDLLCQNADESNPLQAAFGEEWDEFDWAASGTSGSGQEVRWFPASQGLAALRPLLQQRFEQIQRLPDGAAVLDELRGFIHILEQLEAQQIKFHFRYGG